MLMNLFTYIWGKGETKTHDKIYNDIFSGNYGLKASKKDKNTNIKIYQSKKEYAKALNHFNIAIDLDPKDSNTAKSLIERLYSENGNENIFPNPTK